jgi:integrase
MNKAPAGEPKVKVSNGRLQIVFTHQKKRNYLSLGVSDSKANRYYAETVRQWIEKDIRGSRFDPNLFDPTLEKYKRLATIEPEQPPAENLTLVELWERYTDYKRPQLSQTTITKDFDRVRLNIKKFPSVKLADAVVIRDHLVKNTSPNTAKRVLSKLTAACNWGILSNLVDSNPFIGMSADIKSVKKSDVEDINVFTSEERNSIVQRLKDNGSHYAPLVEFLFRTGARPSEAIALQIKHLGKEYRSITFCQSVTWSESGLKLKQGLKTQSQRVFPCGEGLQMFLGSLVGDSPDPDRFLFLSIESKFINIDRFADREWRKVLTSLGAAEKINKWH